jgi:phosphoserine phosphatase
MLHAVGLGIAFNAKPRVQEEAQFTINQQVRERREDPDPLSAP